MLSLSSFICQAKPVSFCSSFDSDKPPTKGVVAVNTGLIHVKRPKSFKLIWPPSDVLPAEGLGITELAAEEGSGGETVCSIWFPEAPKGYVALGCVASLGRAQPPASSVFCISASLVSPCDMRDCIILGSFSWYVEYFYVLFMVCFLVVIFVNE